MTKFTDPKGNAVYIDLRAVIAMSEKTLGNGSLLTLLWTSPNLPDGYFGVKGPIEECLRLWNIVQPNYIE